jgi:putative methionine-R-sulfoxide reductase with GAF domain
MRGVVDALWTAMSGAGYSWVGFYTKTPGKDEMLLGPRRDKPACSPLGMHGICGRCWTARRPIIVTDAKALPADEYVACDPLDRAEVVIPLFDARGGCWGVLDVDSHEAGVFDRHDVWQLTAIVEAAGISTPQDTPLDPVHL